MPSPSVHRTPSGSITASSITTYHGADVVLEQVSLAVHTGARIGVVGPNGIGKSTLLRVLAGLEQPDHGTVSRNPADLQVGYLAQEVEAAEGETVRQFLAVRTGVTEAELDLNRAEVAMASDPRAVDAYTDALERWVALGGDTLEARTEAVCAEVGLPPGVLGQPVADLSGGQAARAALAAVLLAQFDIFLLDEPTNNLDFQGIERLERFLSETKAGVVVVSHDRAFLEACVTSVVELEEGTHRPRHYSGGFNAYLEARELARRQQSEAHQRYMDERDRLAGAIQTKKQWAVAGARRAARKPADPDKGIRSGRVEGAQDLASRARALERRLERLEVVGKPYEGWDLRMSLPRPKRSGDVVVRLQDAVTGRGDFTLGPINLEVRWGERVAFVGKNGSGKSTLLDALLGRLQLRSGRRYIGPGVTLGAVEQARVALGGQRSLLDMFTARSGLPPEEARSLLAKYGLGGGDVIRPSTSLSPGERTRAVLALLVAAGVNCLVLDEPTNHLDLPAIEQLESALEDWEGTLLLVSHDRRFLDRVGVTRRIELHGAGTGVAMLRERSPHISDWRS